LRSSNPRIFSLRIRKSFTDKDISFHFHTSAPYFLSLCLGGCLAPSAFASVALRRCGFPQEQSQENYGAYVKLSKEMSLFVNDYHICNLPQGIYVHRCKGVCRFLFQSDSLGISCRFLVQRSVRRLRCLRELATELRNIQRSCALEDAEIINWSRKQKPAYLLIIYGVFCRRGKRPCVYG
jgi:hypothetical protein